jgi:uncharacterized protein YbjT (DUF2867 family)
VVDVDILVTGGTGTLGRAVVARLRATGAQVRVLSRRPGPNRVVGDLLTGAGIVDALAGIDVVVHCATTLRGRKDVITTRVLLGAAREGRPHVVYISIVGVDRLSMGYYRGKRASELLIERSGLPYTILRATQFHDLLATIFRLAAKLPVLLIPAIRFQPVDVSDVAERLTELARGEPRGRVEDMGGPEVRAATDLARAYLDAVGTRRPVRGFRLPGKLFRTAAAGANTTPEHADGTVTFERYLSGRSSDRSR